MFGDVFILLPVVAFLLLGRDRWALLRRYRDEQPWVEQAFQLFGGDKGGRTAAYVATGAIGLAFLLSLAGFVLFQMDHQGHGTHATAHEHEHAADAKEEKDDEHEHAEAADRWAQVPSGHLNGGCEAAP